MGSAPPPRRPTLRARTTAVAVGVVGLALVLAGLALVLVVRRSLTIDVRAAAALRAAAVADVIGSDRLPELVDVGDRDEEFVQVLDRHGGVIAASANVSGRPALARPPGGQALRLSRVPFEDGPFLAVSAVGSGGTTVVVGRSLETPADVTAALAWSLVAGIPFVTLVVGAVAWRLVGRALAPVEAIREEVDAIYSSELHRRVPVPAGDDEVSRLAGTMNAMLERLQAADARLRRFVADASHELRSPIASIRQHAEVALEHPTTTTLGELAATVSTEVLRLQRIVDDLVLLSRSDEGTLPMHVVDVQLDRLVADEASRLRAATGIEIEDARVEACSVRGDHELLARLVRNLVDNAARHAAGRIWLSLHHDGGAAAFAVDDDGPGIPPADRERVFERFVRLDDARDRGSGGTGLGLAIVREIASAHGASVRATDSSLGGARFEVVFPAARIVGVRRGVKSAPAS